MERVLTASSQCLKFITTEFTIKCKIQGAAASVAAWSPKPRKLSTPTLTAAFLVPPSTSRVCCLSAREHTTNTGFYQNQAPLDNKVLKLISGSCYLPHPDKEEIGGEDANFVLEQTIGIADGVGGWAEVGINAGDYARELMANSVAAIQQEPESFIDPARVLEKAYLNTKSRGSSTACILTLSDRGLHAVNLGDSGFIVTRGHHTLFRSPIQQHSFNCSFQLESGDGSDVPSSAQAFTIHVAQGDVIIAGTDGLFDNLYDSELSALVVDAVADRLGPQATAEKIASSARQRALDKDKDTPFSDSAQSAGYWYRGGKLDDITVVVSFVTAID
uniref:Protein phosphatase n=1 Tax=Araucaria cunninghamii TaxID=56994 RepID=A0A0D6R0W2_ARACU